MIEIHVTQEDIDHGRKGSCVNCPIARAAYRALRGWVEVHQFELNHMGKLYELPPLAIEFILDFDSDCRVEPFTFTLP